MACVVNMVSQFLHAPTDDHFLTLKRILYYFKGTLNSGITFSCTVDPTIFGCSDADWARCRETRRSTYHCMINLPLQFYAYSIFLDGNLVFWSAKKQPTIA